MPLDTVGVIGFGRMGGNMARCLLNECFEVAGTDVNDALADFASAGGQALSSPAAVASTATVVITSCWTRRPLRRFTMVPTVCLKEPQMT